jgi:signal transduction histidine kinase
MDAIAWLSYVRRTWVAAGERDRQERLLAYARLFVALSFSVVILTASETAVRSAAPGRVVLALYFGYALIAFFLYRAGPQRNSHSILIVHAADLVWPGILCAYLGGPESPYYLLLAFALFAAALRWGFGATLASAVAGALIFSVGSALADSQSGINLDVLSSWSDASLFLTRILILLALGALLGYVIEQQTRLRKQHEAISELLQIATPESCFRTNVERLLRTTLRLFKADRLSLVVKENTTGRGFVWRVEHGDSEARVFRPAEIPASEVGRHLFPMPGRSWFLQRRNRSGRYRLLALDEEARCIEKTSCLIPAELFSAGPFRTLLSVTLAFGDDWTGRICLFDVPAGAHLDSELRFFQILVDEVAPAIHSVYLLRRFRQRARTAERIRIARDLHDGVIQSLIGLEMNVDALRRQALGVSPEAADKLAGVRHLLQQEVISLRELVQELRVDELSPQELRRCIADIVDQFQRQTGIEAAFFSDAETARLNPRICRELVHIVHEALTNARKHSGARSVQVRLTADGDVWKLVVEDDGRGFNFAGRHSQVELETSRAGPRVICERVHVVNGELVIESFPNRGARLEVSFAPNAYG